MVVNDKRLVSIYNICIHAYMTYLTFSYFFSISRLLSLPASFFFPFNFTFTSKIKTILNTNQSSTEPYLKG